MGLLFETLCAQGLTQQNNTKGRIYKTENQPIFHSKKLYRTEIELLLAKRKDIKIFLK